MKNNNINNNNTIEEILEVDEILTDDNIGKEENKMKINSTTLYMREVGKYGVLSDEEQRELIKKMKEGDKGAREKLICSNLRLVVQVAKSKAGKGVELEDLIQEGNRGLLIATEKFDADKDVKFSTYAYWWIKNTIEEALEQQSKNIRLPTHAVCEINYINKAINELSDALRRTPSTTEIVRHIDGKFSEKKVVELTNIISRENMMSIDMYLGDEEKTTLGDIVGEEDDGITRDIIKEDKQRIIEELLNSLEPIYRRVIELRFGVGKEKEKYTLEEVGKLLKAEGYKTSISGERVRQIEKKALLELRKYPAEKLALFRELI